MAFSHASLMRIEDDDDRASLVPSIASNNTLINPFQDMMAPEVVKKRTLIRDRCFRLTPIYNDCYDPDKPPNISNHDDYLPYDFGEPLFDDRKALITRFPLGHILARATKRRLRQWVWRVGYNLKDTTKSLNNSIWCCKLCMYFLIKSTA
jgi:hypothetical protein